MISIVTHQDLECRSNDMYYTVHNCYRNRTIKSFNCIHIEHVAIHAIGTISYELIFREFMLLSRTISDAIYAMSGWRQSSERAIKVLT